MPFPSPALSVPSLTTYELSYGGLKFGGIVAGSAYQLQRLGGLDTPPIITADQQRALDQGEFAGLDLSGGRDIPIDLVVRTDGTSLDHARRALGAVMTPQGATEAPLWLQLPSGTFACMARPKKYSGPPVDVSSLVGGGGVANILMHATDPRWYSAPSKTQTVGLPAPLGGLGFPVTFPASFGGGGVGGILQVYNNGLFEMRPVLIFTGPCTNPSATNLSIAGAPTIGFTISLAAGDTLVVGTDFQSAVYTVAGSTAGSSRRNLLTPTSTWFNLPPGLNQIEFNTTDGTQVAGTLTVQSADAWLSL